MFIEGIRRLVGVAKGLLLISGKHINGKDFNLGERDMS